MNSAEDNARRVRWDKCGDIEATASSDICWYYNTPGGCWFGDKCRFRHVGQKSVSTEKPLCRNYRGPGTCPYGNRCRFRHVDKENIACIPSVFVCNRMDVHDKEDLKIQFPASDKKKQSITTEVTEDVVEIPDDADSKPSFHSILYYDTSDSSDDNDDDNDDDEYFSSTDVDANNNNSCLDFPSKVECGECGKSYNTKTDIDGLEKHYKEMVMKMDKQHIKFLKTDSRFQQQASCGVCGRILIRSHSLLSHITDKIKSKKNDWKSHEDFLESILSGFVERDYGLNTEEEMMDWLLMHLVDDYVGQSDSDDSDDTDGGLTGLFDFLTISKHFQSKVGDFDCDDDDSDDNYDVFGFNDDEIYELACQGIKPWDPEASAALEVLYDYGY